MDAGDLDSAGDEPGLAEQERRTERWHRSIRLHRNVIALVRAAWGHEQSPAWLDRMTEYHCRIWIEQLRDKLCGEGLVWAADDAGKALRILKAAASREDEDLLCGFCGSCRSDTSSLIIPGQSANICEQCTLVCEDILQKTLGPGWPPSPGTHRDGASWPPAPGPARWPPGTVEELPKAAAALSLGLRVAALSRRAPWPVLILTSLSQAAHPGQRARVYWSTIALTLAAWGREETPVWLDDATRRRTQVAVARASKAFCGYGARTSARRDARLQAAENQVSAALAEVTAMRRTAQETADSPGHGRAGARVCSFCENGEPQVQKLIAGLDADSAEIGGYICEVCAARCVIICDENLGAGWRSRARRSDVYEKYAHGDWTEYTNEDGIRVRESRPIDEGPRLISGA